MLNDNQKLLQILVDRVNARYSYKTMRGIVIAHNYSNKDRVLVRVYCAEWPVPYVPVFIHVVPWSRGWSMFVSNDQDTPDYRHAPAWYSYLSTSVPNKRGVIGPNRADFDQLADLVCQTAEHLSSSVWPQRLAVCLHKLWGHTYV